jgi:protein SCO1/2
VVWGGLAFVILAVVGLYVALQFRAGPLPIYASMPDFVLTNQDGRAVTLADLRGKVWIADAIFTRCPGQCLVMSEHMKEIQFALPEASPVCLVSMTTDPAFDQPPILKKYAERFSARANQWLFLTGPKNALRAAEIDGLKLAVMDKPAQEQESANDLFLHSEKFVLLDKQGRIRGWFDGEKPGSVATLVSAATTLARE